jgi:predicted AlkP superfamily pyrophosphatase or phosphodiesterase
METKDSLKNTGIIQMKKKILIIGLDGCRPDAMLVGNTPNLKKMAEEGLFCWNAQTEIRTISGPAWTSLLTGAHSEKHRVYDNNFRPRDKSFKTLYYLLKERDPHLKIVAHSHWKPIITKIFEKGILCSKSSGPDIKMTQNLIKDIDSDKGDLYFIQLDDIDAAGHRHSYHPQSRKYVECIEERDKMIGDIMSAIKKRLNDENWLVCVVSDHGGSGHGHGKPVKDDLTIIFLIWGFSIKNTGEIITNDEDMVEIVDIVPTLAAFLDYPACSYWDGKNRISF